MSELGNGPTIDEALELADKALEQRDEYKKAFRLAHGRWKKSEEHIEEFKELLEAAHEQYDEAMEMARSAHGRLKDFGNAVEKLGDLLSEQNERAQELEGPSNDTAYDKGKAAGLQSALDLIFSECEPIPDQE